MSPLDERPTSIVAEDLEVVYQRGAEPAVSGISFALDAGDGLLFTGGHGSGKTSVLRALLGLVVASGHIEVLGSHPGDLRNAPRIGYAPQGRAYRETLTPHEIVTTVVTLRFGRRDESVVSAALDGAGIPTERYKARDLGVEETNRLALACAIAGDPDVLVLDDPWEFPETVAAIDRTRARGGIVVGASHEPGGLPDLFGRVIELIGVDEETDPDEDDPDETDTADAGEPGEASDATSIDDVTDGDA